MFLDFPLESIHKQAFKAAEAAGCAADQGKFWEMHARLFEHQRALEPWSAHAAAIGLDAAKFQACLDSGKYAERIRKDLAQGQGAGVTGTPAFFLAYTDPASSKVTAVASLKGAQPYANFKVEIDRLLAADPPKPAGEKARP